MNKGKITIQFDHNGHRIGESVGNLVDPQKVIPLSQEEYRVDEKTELMNDYTTDFGPWQSAFVPEKQVNLETEADRIERMIRESESGRKGVQQEPGFHHEPAWELDRDTIWPESAYQQVTYRKHPPTSWWKAALAVTGAIITGLAFGLFVLNLLEGSGNESDLAKAPTTLNSEANSPDSLSAAGNEAVLPVSAGMNQAQIANVSIAAQDYSFLQHGVFSTTSSSEAALADLKRKGFAGTVENGDKRYVFAGFALMKSDAARLAKLFQDNNIEIYVKTIGLPAISQISWEGAKPQTVGDFITNGDKLIRMMNGVTIAHLEEIDPSPFDPATLSALQDAHALWVASTADLKDGGAAYSFIQSMESAMNTALAALEQYANKPSTASLWEAQAAMMKYILTQKQLYETISVI